MLVLVMVSASVILVSGSREWVSGSVEDAVLGSNPLHGKGSDLAPGAMAAALVGLASAVAAATSGAVVRAVASGAALLAAVLGVTVVVLVLSDPQGSLGTLAAAGTGRSGAVAAYGQVAGWAWVALASLIVMGAGALGGLVGGRTWRGLSSRYDAPVAGEATGSDPAGKPAPRHESAWDQLSRGEDPTAERPATERPATERPTVG